MSWSSTEYDGPALRKTLPTSAISLLNEATNGSMEPTEATATYWRLNLQKYIALCECAHDVLYLLACGVPLDLLATDLHKKVVEKLPEWQKRELHVCTMVLTNQHVDNQAQEHFRFHCTKCDVKLRFQAF